MDGDLKCWPCNIRGKVMIQNTPVIFPNIQPSILGHMQTLHEHSTTLTHSSSQGSSILQIQLFFHKILKSAKCDIKLDIVYTFIAMHSNDEQIKSDWFFSSNWCCCVFIPPKRPQFIYLFLFCFFLVLFLFKHSTNYLCLFVDLSFDNDV